MADKYVAYVGTYTHENSIGIHVFDMDLEKGALKERSIIPINNPSYVAASKNGKYVYSIADEGLAAYSIDENGDLTEINKMWIGGMRGCFIETDSKNRYAFIAGFHDGKVTMMKLNDDGSIAGIADGIFHQAIGKSMLEKRLEPRVSCVRLTPDEKYLCVVEWGLNQVRIYEVDYKLGKLNLVDILRCGFNTAPRQIIFSNDGKFAYLLEEAANCILIYNYRVSKKGPVFEKISEFAILGKEDRMSSSYNIRISSDDAYVYTSMDGTNQVACMSRASDGSLTLESITPISGDFPKSIALFPDNQTIISLNHDTNEIRTFTIDHEKKTMYMKNIPLKVDKPNSIFIHKLV